MDDNWKRIYRAKQISRYVGGCDQCSTTRSTAWATAGTSAT